MFRFWGGLLLIFNDDDSTNNTVHESENVKRRNGKLFVTPAQSRAAGPAGCARVSTEQQMHLNVCFFIYEVDHSVCIVLKRAFFPPQRAFLVLQIWIAFPFLFYYGIIYSEIHPL